MGKSTLSAISEIIERLFPVPKAASKSMMCSFSAPSCFHFIAVFMGPPNWSYTLAVLGSPRDSLTILPFIKSMAGITCTSHVTSSLFWQSSSGFLTRCRLTFLGETACHTRFLLLWLKRTLPRSPFQRKQSLYQRALDTMSEQSKRKPHRQRLPKVRSASLFAACSTPCAALSRSLASGRFCLQKALSRFLRLLRFLERKVASLSIFRRLECRFPRCLRVLLLRLQVWRRLPQSCRRLAERWRPLFLFAALTSRLSGSTRLSPERI